jgi:hypothetical protein
LETPRKTTKVFSEDGWSPVRNFNSGPPEYKTRVYYQRDPTLDAVVPRSHLVTANDDDDDDDDDDYDNFAN